MLLDYLWHVAQDDLTQIFRALEESGGRYLVVGGVACVLHGHVRLTADVDLVVALDQDNVSLVMEALVGLGYRPRAPVSALDFAKPDVRDDWVQNKGMMVFSLWNPAMPLTEVDLFVEEPFPFEEAFARAAIKDLGDVVVRTASIDDLIALKSVAGRPKDLEDVRILSQIRDKLKVP